MASTPSPTKNVARDESAVSVGPEPETSVFCRNDGTNSFAVALRTLDVDVECWRNDAVEASDDRDESSGLLAVAGAVGVSASVFSSDTASIALVGGVVATVIGVWRGGRGTCWLC